MTLTLINQFLMNVCDLNAAYVLYISFDTYSKGLCLSLQESMLKRSSLNGRVTTISSNTITHIYNGKVVLKMQV